ncbi:MAG: UDP-N-acetylmuramate dehydrogenase [Chthonomonas sp.]|nr:UDP-N-acetylmuramate dehydrogenase [Chthonomonas sp.]
MTVTIQQDVPIAKFCTLKAGGNAELFGQANHLDELAELLTWGHDRGHPITILGGGSNMLPSDRGVPGLVILNRTKSISISADDGVVHADTGVWFQELFLKTAQVGLGGLEYAVGIPGSVGGALVSNAGAYRSNISEHITALEVVQNGVRMWADPEIMEFAYRDSVLRATNPPRLGVLQIRLALPRRAQKEIYDEARDYQRQRISKQPAMASAGSFFKNVYDQRLADSLPNLPARLKAAGVVPAGYLIDQAKLAGASVGGAMFARRHANFMINARRATATDIRMLAGQVRDEVEKLYGVRLEEEVLYLGDWSDFSPQSR